MNGTRNPVPHSTQAASAVEPRTWVDVLEAYAAEQAAQREYEAMVCSVVATRALLEWDVMHPLLMRRRVAHEAFVRTYRLWERCHTLHNGTGPGHAGRTLSQAHSGSTAAGH